MNQFRNVLFVPHGAPTFALNPGAAGTAMSNVTLQLDEPRAIVVVSPHWDTAKPTVGTAKRAYNIASIQHVKHTEAKARLGRDNATQITQSMIIQNNRGNLEYCKITHW